ncbi:hypothetical protein [Actinomadura sp. K4S16]|uniref:glycoside hydrolase family 78 protein n=1 Tax=Actinomadura sp. K4S16 TaxID=1316147 RepID=UPI00135B03B2|nr:hypothetical protein [Actinomadura sp. K4S16]
MTTVILIADATDGTISSRDNHYVDLVAGSGLQAVTDQPTGQIGQDLIQPYFYAYQTGLAFTPAASTDTTVTAAYLRLYQAAVGGTGVARSIEIAEYDWGGVLDTGNWRTPAQLKSLVNGDALAAVIDSAHLAGIGQLRAGLEPGHLPDATSATTRRYILYTSRFRTQQVPSGPELHTVRLTEFSGTSQDPALLLAHTTKHITDTNHGGHVQLSDGTHAYLRQGATAPATASIAVVHHNGTTATTVFSDPLSAGRQGAQIYTLCADGSDNLYILNGNNDLPNILRVRGFTKGAGHNWTAGPVRDIPLATYEGEVNNVAAAWHTSGSGGTILAVVAHNAGRNTGTQTGYALINPVWVRTGSGTALRGSGNAEGVLIDNPAPDGGIHNYVNETGTLLDVAAAPSSSRGYITCTTKQQVLGDPGAQSFARYELNASGTGFASVARLRDTSGAFSTKDADAKSRVIGIDDSRFVTVNADATSGRGITVVHRQSLGSGSITELARVTLGTESLTAMPDPSVLATSPAWDAVYNPVDNRVWIYYIDAANPNRLMRTPVSLTTGQAGRSEVQVNAAVGAAGSTNRAVRVHRGRTAGSQVVIGVSNRTSGGAHSLIAVTDRLNALPTQPIPTPRANFDATAPTPFEWMFTDPDPADAQSAFQVEIYDTATGALAHDSTKTTSATQSYTLPASTLANGGTYRWRVRTWDGQDEESPWTGYGTFATSASGSVTITAPATDNDPAVITSDVLVTWTVTGTTQAAYQVVVRRTDTLAVLLDTGWVDSTATSHLVTGMAAGTEYLVRVTVRNAAQVASNTAERLITPNYASPEVPTVAVEAFDDGGYILVTVTNPAPQGDRPNPSSNQIFRRRAGSGTEWLLIAEVEPGATFRDYTAPSGTEVEYMARAGVLA